MIELHVQDVECKRKVYIWSGIVAVSNKDAEITYENFSRSISKKLSLVGDGILVFVFGAGAIHCDLSPTSNGAFHQAIDRFS